MLVAVALVSRSCEHCPDGFDLHLLQFWWEVPITPVRSCSKAGSYLRLVDFYITQLWIVEAPCVLVSHGSPVAAKKVWGLWLGVC